MSVFAFAAGCTAFELEPLSYKEALKLYQARGGIENYRCALLPADTEYRVAEHALPVAVEIDDWLFIRLEGVIYPLPQQHITDTEVLYGAEELSAELLIKKQFNQSEYGESGDRFVELTVTDSSQIRTYHTAGTACGI